MSTPAFDPAGPASADAGIFGLTDTPQQARLVLLPVPFDATTSYGHGTANAPAAILRASHQVELYDMELGRPYEHGIAMLEHPVHIEALNRRASLLAREQRAQPDSVASVNQLCGDVNQWVFEQAQALLEQNKIVGTIGGDHATPLGSILAHANVYPSLSVLHIDAHCDLRPAYEGFVYSHASIMHNVMMAPRLRHDGPLLKTVASLTQVGIRDFCEEEHDTVRAYPDRIRTFFDAELTTRAMEGEPFAATAGAIVDTLSEDVYVSLDIDGLEPAFCPHTGTPVPGGLHYRQVLALLKAVRESGRRIVGFDLNEVCPGPKGQEWDANVGARLVYKLAGYALAKPTKSKQQALGFFG